MNLSDNIANWIKDQVEHASAKGVVVGLSGGIDSACVAALSKKALGDNVLGLILPCYSNPEDEKFARLVAEKFKIKTEKKVLDLVYDELVKLFPRGGKVPLANLKPRLRMITLYYFAGNLNYLVAGCGNKSEIAVGYFTKYGDGGADMFPLGGLLKTEVRQLAEVLGVPREVIDRPPTAGLWEGQTDEGELGLSYADLDKAILAIEGNTKKEGSPDGETIDKVKKLMRISEHKRVPVPIFKKV